MRRNVAEVRDADRIRKEVNPHAAYDRPAPFYFFVTFFLTTFPFS